MSTPGRPPIPPPPIAGTTSSSSARFPSPPAERPPPQPHPHSSSSPDPLANSDDSIHTLSSVTSLSSTASGATTSSFSSFEQFTATPLPGVGVGSGTGTGKGNSKGAPTQNPYAGLKFSAPGTLGGEKEATEDPLAMANRFERLGMGLGIGAGSFTLPPSEGMGMGHASGSGSPSPSSAGTTRPALPAIVTTSMQTRGVEAPSPVHDGRERVESPAKMKAPPSPSPSYAPSPGAHHFLPPQQNHPRHHPRSSLSSLSPRSATFPSNVQSTVSNGMTRASSSSSSSSAPSSRPLSAASPTGGGKSSTSRPSSRSGSGSATPATATSGSSRPWVFDSDASSVCSGHSGSGVGGGAAAPSAASSTTRGGGGGGGTSGYASSSSSGHGGGQEQAAGVGKRRVIVNEDGTEEVVDEGGEVFKAPGDMEFLDHRPEPPGVSLSFDRSSPSQLLILVTLPGFSLENITVAMKRSHKLHIVADAYGENGGHYERLLGLGSDISTAAPRAEFDGTVLRVYVQRRPSRPSSAASVAGSTPAPFGLPGIGGGYGMPFAGASSPPNGGPSPFSSPEMDHTRRPSIASSLASVWSDASTGSSSQAHYPPLSPSLEPHHHHHHFASTSTSSPFDPSLFLASSTSTSSVPLDPPHTAHAPPSPLPGCSSTHAQKRSKSLIGPEGARAAAKAAKEELAKRAKEEAGRLPEGARGGRWFPFKDKAKKAAVFASGGESGSGSGSASGNSSSSEVSSTFSSSSAASSTGGGSGSGSGTDATETSGSEASPPLEKALAAELERNSTIKASRSPSPRPPPLSAHSSGGSSTTIIAATATSSSASVPAPATRPKLRSNNLTLRPLPHSDQSPSSSSSTASSVFGAAASTEGKSPSGSAGSDGGGVTPRWEVGGMSFTPAS